MLPTGSLITKDPDVRMPKGIDWTTWLARLGPDVLLESSSWSITGPDAELTFDDATDSIVTGNRQTQLELLGGTLGKKYRVTNHIVADTGASEDKSFFVKIKQE